MSRTPPVMPTIPVAQSPASPGRAFVQNAPMAMNNNGDQQAINYLINNQIQLAHIMREIGIKLAAPNVAYPGFSIYFIVTAKKLEKKATKLMLLIQLLGGSYTLNPINPQNTGFENPAAALEAIVGFQDAMVNNLKLAAVNDPALKELISHVVKKKALWLGFNRGMLTRLNRVRNDPAGLQRLDDELLVIELYKKYHNKLYNKDNGNNNNHKH
ncbi:Hypothetical protein HVR_LOCUS1004 [uncultured virus]|nr:Hypothetical protein HVR_LOCUS1004 [uncultured virus]